MNVMRDRAIQASIQEIQCFVFCRHLQYGSVEEEGQQLDQVIVDVAVLLLHANDVGRMIGSIPVHLALVEGEEAKLEEVFDDDGDLERKMSKQMERSGLVLKANGAISFHLFGNVTLAPEEEKKKV